ncbi:DUF5682 family protein [Pedosphaera parvula]|uniref:Uncharacterized protein n=1 Tax=Pedosphaera parvula (strain Ellin514) TaxID=320771 RepID=B9XDN6_PEDPL|nr:DUF5682 family protein [Pedosphaera parvula]EEF62182.1 conserved hypothetical protein [Pedosphaera parvula Ellin514]
MSVHIFGIRHHGPGSARSLREALEALKPDMILVEGPPDAEAALPLLMHEQMEPPVALLVYVPENPKQAVYYPFAVFSPEWQALRYGFGKNVPVRFMDLPLTHQLAEEALEAKEIAVKGDEADAEAECEECEITQEQPIEPALLPALKALLQRDPLAHLAEAAGYSDSERWWEHMVEHRHNSTELFEAILEAMTALREASLESSLAILNPLREQRREAHMRQTIRVAEKEGFQRIAVVCGAWHAPALTKMPAAKEDAELLKGLLKVKVQATWVPWTYGRLAFASGYGAGIESPGWYQHLWDCRDGKKGRNAETQDIIIKWLTRVAHLLRGEDLDASSASVIETVRLAESLAAVRSRPLPGLPELNEATQTVLCHGEHLPLRLIHDKLVVSERLGKVPDETPVVPLQQDLQREQKRLRLPPEALEKMLDLDLRKDTDLGRSQLLHRLNLLNIPWGQAERASGKKGTFHEVWRVRWQPEFAVAIIEAAIWGNTVASAASGRAYKLAEEAPALPELTALLDQTLLADLPDAIRHIMVRLQNEAAVASDVPQLMAALPPLAQILRYGNVRQTDSTLIDQIVSGLVARICIGLPVACASLDDEAAADMFERLLAVQSALSLLQKEEYLKAWQTVLKQLSQQQGIHGLLAGRCCRLLMDAGVFSREESARRMGLALSTANEPVQAAAWVEGFLKGSGLLLLHDESLWQVLDEWVCELKDETFTALLPLLRRTFSTFSAPERRQMGERVRSGTSKLASQVQKMDFDEERAAKVLPLVAKLLGIEN